MRSSSTTLFSFLILIFVSSCFSNIEEDLELPLLAHRVDDGVSDGGRQLKGSYSGSSRDKSLVPAQPKIYNRIVNTLCEEVDQLLALETGIPKSAGESNWKIYYKLAPKALYQDREIPELNALVKAVTRLGYKFTSTKCTSEKMTNDVVPCINLAHSALNLDSLGMRERLWVVGVLSCLESKISKQIKQRNSGIFGNAGQPIFRGKLELLLLQGWPLGIILEKMWPSPLQMIHYPPTPVWEALDRASLVDSVICQMPTSTKPSPKLQTSLQLLLRSEFSVEEQNVSETTTLITGHLENILYFESHAFVYEREVMIKMLLHMQQNYYPSRMHFLRLMKNQLMAQRVLEVDIGLEDTMTQYTKDTLHELLKNIKTINTEALIPALNRMVLENETIAQCRKLLRVLDLANRQNPSFQDSLILVLSDSIQFTRRLSRILHQQYPKTNHPRFFRRLGSELLALLAKKRQEYMLEDRRNELEAALVAKGVLFPEDVEPFRGALGWKFEDNRQLELLKYLKKLILRIQSKARGWDALLPTDPIVEYIINIICLKNNDDRLLTWLSHRDVPHFRQISYPEFVRLKELLKNKSEDSLESVIGIFEKEICETVKNNAHFIETCVLY